MINLNSSTETPRPQPQIELLFSCIYVKCEFLFVTDKSDQAKYEV